MTPRNVLLALLVAVAVYGLIEAYPLLSGPTLLIIAPGDGQVEATGVATISGTSLRAVSLTLNGAPLLADQEGHFGATLAYPAGTSILTFVARDRFGRTRTATRTIYVPN